VRDAPDDDQVRGDEASRPPRAGEQAGLVVTHRHGRTKLHYLNPVPIREIHDRWITKYAQPVAAAMAGLRADLEADTA
jgi:hypothetical protein